MALPISYSIAEKELIRQFIQRGDVPSCLYKYRTVDSAKLLLENHSIYFSSCMQLNDPFVMPQGQETGILVEEGRCKR